jgi:hypothetical protein
MLVAAQPAPGCAGPSYQDYVSFFEFSLANDPIYRNYHYYEISPPLGPLRVKSTAKRDYYDNLAEWRQFFTNRASVDEIENVIYDSKNKNILLYALACLKDGIPVDTARLGGLAKNRLLDYIIKSKLSESLEYIIFAKDCEPWVTNWDPWEDPPRRDFQAMQRLIETGWGRYSKTNSDFIKLRYAYQVVRLAQYSGQPEKCITYYDQMVPGLNIRSIITYWAMGHKAGALRTTGKPLDSLILTSLIFDQCPNMMDNALRDFYIPDETLWKECLSSLNNNHRKATLWMLRGLKEERLTMEPLINMFELEPKSARLEMMLIRETNKVERQYLTSAVFFPAGRLGQTPDFDYIKQLQAFALRGANSGQIRQPGLWYLTAGYLSLMMKDFSQANSWLTRAEAVNSNGTELRRQIALVKNLITIAAGNTISPATEAAIYADLIWAGGLVYDYNNQAIYRSLLLLLGQKYLAAGEVAKAAGCFNKAGYESSAAFLVDIYSTNADLERMIALVQSKDKNDLEVLLARSLRYSANDIRCIEATKLMRKAKFAEALAIYKQIQAGYWDKYRKPKPVSADDYWFNDPGEYSGGLWTNFENTGFDLSRGYSWLEAYQQKKLRFYTRLDFAAKLTALQTEARANPKDAAKYYRQIANGFFHSPFWGYNDQVWRGNLINGLSRYPDYPFNVLDFAEKYQAKIAEFYKEYGTRTLALQYYRKAIAAASDKELAAQCAALAFLCQEGFAPDSGNEEREIDGTFFDLLRKNYAGTETFRHLMKECATLKDFLGNQ